ncbi:hypothetical protein ACFL0M_02030, partial [Thermodesulfobacteriota bacterium]
MDNEISSAAITKEAFFLADLIINKYTSKEGGIFERVDVQNGKVLVSDCAIDELGDYIQYIIYLGILTSKKDYIDWGVSSISLIAKNYQSEKGLFYNRSRENWIGKNLLSLNNADTI